MDRRLLMANVVLASLLFAHIVDHELHQSQVGQLSGWATLPGPIGVALVLVPLPLILLRKSYAAPVALVTGLLTAFGFVAIHLAPHWSLFSDPYYDRALDGWSWLEMLATLSAGLWVAYEARRVMKAAGSRSGAPSSSPPEGAPPAPATAGTRR